MLQRKNIVPKDGTDSQYLWALIFMKMYGKEKKLSTLAGGVDNFFPLKGLAFCNYNCKVRRRCSESSPNYLCLYTKIQLSNHPHFEILYARIISRLFGTNTKNWTRTMID